MVQRRGEERCEDWVRTELGQARTLQAVMLSYCGWQVVAWLGVW